MPTPNIIYIYADDLGRGMLSCYGQKHYQTPHIDRLAMEGVRMTQAYGTSFCAPARACLMTGMHDAHAGRWTFTKAGVYKDYHDGKLDLVDLYELIHNTGIRPRDGQRFLAHMAREAGYVTGQIGKLEWGFSTTGPELEAHGWDTHYGYYDHERNTTWQPSSRRSSTSYVRCCSRSATATWPTAHPRHTSRSTIMGMRADPGRWTPEPRTPCH